MTRLQHLNINTLGIVWDRTPSDYLRIKKVLSTLETIRPDGTPALYTGG
jgi:hypothetical protein